MAFADLFTLTRARTGSYRDAGGVLRVAAVDVARFDHTEAGAPRGLLVEGRPEYRQADKLSIVAAAWPNTPGTILHEFETLAGVVRRRAWYAVSPRLALNGLLNIKGRQRHIGVMPGYLRNRGGFVVYGAARYVLGGVIAVAPYTLLDASAVGEVTPLIEG